MFILKNEIGCSLPFDYLASVDGTEFKTLFGTPNECVKLLRTKGVSNIELRSVSNDTSPDILTPIVELLLELEMNVSIHGILPETPECDMPAIFALPSDRDFMVTIHACSGGERNEEWYAENSLAILRGLIERAPANIKFALELNRRKESRKDPGNNYDMLLTMIKALDSERVGICWDLGHSESNVRNGYSPQIPTDDFIRRVVHTHIHGLSVNGRTHFPLTGENLPLTEYLDPLIKSGYSGILNFEPDIDRWTDAVANKREAFLYSIDILRRVR